MKETIEILLPMGFRMEDREERVSLWEAERRLLSGKRRCYTSATRQGEQVLLRSRWIRCPRCGEDFAANTGMFTEQGLLRPENRAVTKRLVEEWASPQLMLPEFSPKGLVLSQPMEAPALFQCPDCGAASRNSEGSRKVELRLSRGKLQLRCQICTLEDLMSLGWPQRRGLFLSLPAWEVLTFHFGRGRVYVRLEDGNDRLVACRDVTYCPEVLEKGAVSSALGGSAAVRRKLRQLFRKQWGSELPYRDADLTLPVLIRMTQFQGYGATFYSGIPYCIETCRIDRSFAPAVRQLRRADKLPALYERTGLPQVKSLRRKLFEEPSLFFFREEIRFLWELLQDPNLLCRLLSGDRIFEILNALHRRPGIRLCLTDYRRMFGGVGLCRDMEEHWPWLLKCAVDYCSLSDHARRALREQWKTHRQKRHYRYFSAELSRPMAQPPKEIPDCTVDGYDFSWLRSSNDYCLAARQLSNCLGEHSPLGAPVLCIRRYGQTLAAVEVDGGKVLQARGYDNAPLEGQLDLFRVLEKWMERFCLSWDEDGDGGEIYEDPVWEDLPF